MKRKCNASANPTRTLPPRIVGDLEGGEGGQSFVTTNKVQASLPSPGTTLWPWFVTRLISIPHVESVYIYGNVNVRSSLHDCEWYAHMYPCQVCEMFMNMVWNTPLVYYNSKWILNSEIKMFIKNSNVFKRSETKRQFVSENIENSLCTQAILKTDFFSNCPC